MIVEAEMLHRYRFLVADRDRHGNVRIYFRRGRTKVRIREEIGTPAFAKRYEDLCGTVPVKPVAAALPRSETFEGLCEAYRRSTAFTQELGKSTQRTRANLIEAMLDEPIYPGAREIFRGFPKARITLDTLEILRDRKGRALPGAANDRVKTLRKLFEWASAKRSPNDKPHLPSNPAANLAKLKVKTSGHHTWTSEEVEQFEARHPLGTIPHLALRLMLFTGARRSDATRLGRQHVRSGNITWTAYKNRERFPAVIDIPVLSPLQEAIDATGANSRMVFLVTSFGKPFSIAGFGNWFHERCVEAGLLHCSAHGLRKAGSTRAAEAGATAHQLMAMFGWRSLAEAERYTREAERKGMAKIGIGKLLEGVNAGKSVPLSRSVPGGGTKQQKRSIKSKRKK
jgi:integrase